MGQCIGYARVSREDQSVAMQIEALEKAGCETIYSEKESGGRWNRPQLQKMLAKLAPGDTVYVWKCDRLARSQADLTNLVALFESKNVRFVSLTESFDTHTPTGRMFLQILTSFGEFERAVIRERTIAGLDHARRQGRIGGRPPALRSDQRSRLVEDLRAGNRTHGELARLYRVSPSTISRFAAKVREEADQEVYGANPLHRPDQPCVDVPKGCTPSKHVKTPRS